MEGKMTQGLLAPYRVLDLTDEKGFLCGKTLADLGAGVIKVERPGGDPSRNIEPFYHDTADSEKSLYWFAYNVNKRGITLDIETNDGKEIFKKLVKTADFVIESFPPGYMDGLGLGYSNLAEINPRIIVTSITPFGQKGPCKEYKGSDLTLVAMGGLLYITGYPDRPPVRISFPQAWLLGSCQAVAATMIAHYYRELVGEGQHVDVSIQASVVWTITNAIPLWELDQSNLMRLGSIVAGRSAAGARQHTIFKCKDGFVAYGVLGGRAGVGLGNPRLAKWIDEEGMADDFLRNFDWESYDLARATQETQGKLEAYVEKFFLKHAKLELYNEGLKRGISIFPAYSPRDMAADSQLEARDFWIEVEHPELNDVLTYPSTFFKIEGMPFEVRYRAPLIGEHNQEVYQELGFSEEELSILKQANII
jgi:crotonobetainyl-CoA:carnitine CoA-transferase CaiB-like acyl-CoA transferase